jgi:hypothetical protein
MDVHLAKKIVELSFEFRKALETLDRSEWGDAWPTISTNCIESPTEGICDVAHHVLARIIEDRFDIQASLISGEKGERTGENSFYTHRWLRIDNMFIDVTGNNDKVEISIDPSFHEEWNGNDIGQANHKDIWWFCYCVKAYEDISCFLDNA